MKALIDPRFNRVCEVRENDFPVASPLYWVDVPQGVSPTTAWTYDGTNFIPPLGPTFDHKANYKAMIRRRAAILEAKGSAAEALLLLKTIGE